MDLLKEILVPNGYEVLQAIKMKNKCCEDREILLTRTSDNIYSCQCSCGGWCTSGFDNAQEAISAYERMNKIAEKEETTRQQAARRTLSYNYD